MTEADGRLTEWTYNAAYMVISETVTNGAAYTYDYTYDPAGNRTSVTKPVTGTSTYTYDEMDQLVREDHADGSFETYVYDDRGNLTAVNDLGNPEFSTAAYTWDARDRLEAAQVGSAFVDYEYDFQNLRTSEVVDGFETHYLWDTFTTYGDVVLASDGDGNPLVDYTLGLGLISQHRAGETHYFHQDALGSTQALTDEAGAVLATYDYSSFGELLASDDGDEALTEYLFAGQDYDDDTGLYTMRARLYHPETGRFLSRDTYPVNYANPAEYNRYGYAANNPVNLTDPSGYSALSEYMSNVSLNAVAFEALRGFAVGGITSGVVDAVFQLLVTGEINWQQVGVATLEGALFGALGGGIGALGAASKAAYMGTLLELGSDFVFSTIYDAMIRGVPLREAIVMNGIASLLFGAGMEFTFGRGRNAPAGRNLDTSPNAGRRSDMCPDGNSFSADTTVSTPDGNVPISEVEIGDTVYAYNEESGEVEEREVVHVFEHDDDQIVYLTIDGEEIETTPWHPFYTDAGWEDAGDLQPGDLILSLDGDYGVVESIVIVDETQTMYDLDVETVDTFAVGDGAWVVHNNDCTGIGDQIFETRREAMNAAKDRAGISRSQQPVDQWVVGNNVMRLRTSNYRFSRDKGTHGNYWVYRLPNNELRVIVEHTSDPNITLPHFHAGRPKPGGDKYNYDFRRDRYQQVNGRHHYCYGCADEE